MSHSIHDAPAASPGRYRWLTTTIRAFNANKTSWLGLAVFLIVLLLAILAPWISPHDPVEQDVFSKLKPPFDTYYLGTDYFGRDILSRLL
jgi:peptide/nickel transport system permease protein